MTREEAIKNAEHFLRKDALAYANMALLGRVRDTDGRWTRPGQKDVPDLLKSVFVPRLLSSAENLLASLAEDDQ